MLSRFEHLKVWKKAHVLVIEIYRITQRFPKEERFCLTDQLRRAVLSVPANIVEGHTRKSKHEFLHFLSISKGSLEETKYFLLVSKDLEYITTEEYKQSKVYFLVNSSYTFTYSSTIRSTVNFSSTCFRQAKRIFLYSFSGIL